MIIRSTTDEDWKILKQIRLASLLDAPRAFGVRHATAAAYSDSDWRDRSAKRGQAQFFLAIIHGEAVGMVGALPAPPSDLGLIAMWVRHEYRGTATAAGLVDAIKTRAISEGHARVILDVSPGNERAAAFYRKQGFSFLPEWAPLASHPDISVQKMEWRTSLTGSTPSD
jgi:GNAT superfamily N-acetyltransferase